MKKNLREKQLKKRMTTSKKGVTLAATALILSGSPIGTLAEEAASDSTTTPTIAKEAKENLTSSSEVLLPEMTEGSTETTTTQETTAASTEETENVDKDRMSVSRDSATISSPLSNDPVYSTSSSITVRPPNGYTFFTETTYLLAIYVVPSDWTFQDVLNAGMSGLKQYTQVGSRQLGTGTSDLLTMNLEYKQPAGTKLAYCTYTKDASENLYHSFGLTTVLPSEQTTISEVTTDSILVTGKSEPNMNILLAANGGIISSGRTDNNGNYVFSIPKQSVGTIISIVSAADGKTVLAQTTVKQGSMLVQTTISDITTDTTQVSGKGEPNADIIIIVKNGSNVIGKIDSSGNYKFNIPKQPFGAVIKAIVTKDGLTSQAQTTVKQGSLMQTTISDITTDTTQVSGKGEPNATIELKNGNTVIASGTVASDGSYTLPIPKQSAGATIVAVVTKDGLTSQAQTTVKQGSLAQTTISAITTETTQVSGKGEPNGKIELKNGNTVIASGTVGSDGNYTLPIPKQSAGATIVAVVTKNGVTSQAQTTVKQGSLVQTTISDITTETTQVSGKGEPNGKIELKNGNTVIASGTVASDGSYTLPIPKQSAGTTIVAVVTKDGLTSQAQTTVKQGNVVITNVGTYKEGKSQFVTGTYNGSGVAYMRILVNGVKQEIIKITSQPTGTFQYYTKALKGTDNVQVVLFNKDYVEVARKTVPIEEKSPIEITNVEAYREGKSDYVRGTYSGEGVAYMRIVVDGKNQMLIPTSSQTKGTFQYYTKDLKAGQTVQVVLFDKNYKEIGRKTVPINSATDVAITNVEEYQVGTSDYVRGTYSGSGAAYMRILVNGVKQEIIKITNQPTGTFQYYTKGLKAGQTVQVVLFDNNYQELDKRQVTIKASNVQITNLESYTEDKSEWIRGTYTGDVAHMRIVVDGKNQTMIPLKNQTKGTFQYYVKGLKASQTVQVVLLDNNYQELVRRQVTIKAPEVSNVQITNLESYTEGKSEWIRGTYTGDNVVYARIIVNGTEEMAIPLKNQPAGTFEYYKRGLTQTDNVQMVLLNSAMKELKRQTVVISPKA